MLVRLLVVAATLTAGAVGAGACGGGAGGGPAGSDGGDGAAMTFMGKDKTFTKVRGPNTPGSAGHDVAGTCTLAEKGKAACYGNLLIQCGDDGKPHVIDCTSPELQTLTMHRCVEDDSAADCQ